MATKNGDNNGIPPKQSDWFLKGAFEEWFFEFLRFVYPNADELFDFDRGITFMDKELLAIVPDRDRRKGKRVADLLVKVWLRDGSQQLILLNVEIEGGNDPDFPLRVWEYNYRARDRFSLPVATIVVYTGNRGQNRPSEYSTEVLNTSIHFRYLAYHIFDHGEQELLDMGNAFALIVLACQKALLEGKVPEEELGEDRNAIVKALMATGKYDKDQITSFLVFLKNFIFIENEEINRNFDRLVYKVTGGTIDMGVIEVLKKQEREQGRLEERVKAEKLLADERAKAEAEKLDIACEMKKDGLPIQQIAKFTKLSIEVIEKL